MSCLYVGMSLSAWLKFGICDIYFTQNLFIFYVNSMWYDRLITDETIIWLCFYVKEIYVLYLKTLGFLLSYFLVISTPNIGKVVSMLFSQRWSNADERTQLSFLTKYKNWNNIDLSTLNQRNSFSVVSTLFYQRWNNIDKHASAQISFSTKFQHWNNEFYRRWIDVILSTLFQRYFAKVETTSINVRRLNFIFN